MFLSRTQQIILGGAAFFIIFLLLVFLGALPGFKKNVTHADLTLWGVGDSPQVWQNTISAWNQISPAVSVKYREFDEASYEAELINALAAGRGPDIFMLHNTWLPKHGDKITPAPVGLINLTTLRNLFPDVAETNLTANNLIYALPLDLDTLALLYNKDIFNNKGIALAPKSWDGVKADILKVREVKAGKISKAGIALGGSTRSVENAPDILSLLMLQFGTPMVAPSTGQAIFNNQNGWAALNFYSQFTNSKSPYYTWGNDFMKSFDSFAQGKSAMTLAYAADIPKIKNKNPFLNFGVSSAPQFDKNAAVNFPSYWNLAVSGKSKNLKVAWDFVLFATTSESVASNYMNAALKPPALRSLIAASLNNPNLGVFASQALTAKSWREADSTAINGIFDNVIESVISGGKTPNQALEEAQNKVNDLIR